MAVTLHDARRGLGRLDPESRALLDLSLRRGLDDGEIGAVLRVDAGDVKRRRDAAFDELASILGVSGREERDELFATLPDLPAEHWRGTG